MRVVNFRASLFAAAAGLAMAGAAQAQTSPAAPAKAATPAPANQPASGEPSTVVDQVVVTASRVNILGVAETASQGVVTAKELSLRPVYRPGQLLETTPGLVVTTHSGEGKANQYLVRGFNLDHGTDIANFIDDMPVNRPSNTHGQGYSDVNFFVAEMAAHGLEVDLGQPVSGVGAPPEALETLELAELLGDRGGVGEGASVGAAHAVRAVPIDVGRRAAQVRDESVEGEVELHVGHHLGEESA